MIMKHTNLVDGLRLLYLDLRRGGVDGVRNVRLEGDQDPASIRDALAEAVVEVGVLVDEAVVARWPVKVYKGRPECRQKSCWWALQNTPLTIVKCKAYHQCDQMASLFFQYLAIYNNELLSNSTHKFAKVGSQICQKRKEPSKNCQRLITFQKVAKFGQIWSHCIPWMMRLSGLISAFQTFAWCGLGFETQTHSLNFFKIHIVYLINCSLNLGNEQKIENK